MDGALPPPPPPGLQPGLRAKLRFAVLLFAAEGDRKIAYWSTKNFFLTCLLKYGIKYI